MGLYTYMQHGAQFQDCLRAKCTSICDACLGATPGGVGTEPSSSTLHVAWGLCGRSSDGHKVNGNLCAGQHRFCIHVHCCCSGFWQDQGVRVGGGGALCGTKTQTQVSSMQGNVFPCIPVMAGHHLAHLDSSQDKKMNLGAGRWCWR